MNAQPEHISDERLFIRYVEGDGDAFRSLMDRYAVRLLRYCRGFVDSEEEAEDLVQETFLRAIRSASTYRATSRFSTWIYTITRNLAIDRLKIDRNRADLEAGRQAGILESTMSTPPSEPDAIESGSLREQLQTALRVLTPLEAETIRLTFFAEWTTGQIAELQRCSRATVRTRRFQALKKIRQEIRQVMNREHFNGSLRKIHLSGNEQTNNA